MLGFLLFASVLHFDYHKFREQQLPGLMLSTLGVLVSTALFAGLLYAATRLLHISIPFAYCLVFGALISPTDRIAAIAHRLDASIPLAVITAGLIVDKEIRIKEPGLTSFSTRYGTCWTKY